MTPLLFVLAAATGAVIRHLVSSVACSWQALLIVNTAGSAALGAAVSSDLSGPAMTIVGTGLCGAVTTFGSVVLEVRSLGWRYGTLYAFATLVSVCGAASLATTF